MLPLGEQSSMMLCTVLGQYRVRFFVKTVEKNFLIILAVVATGVVQALGFAHAVSAAAPDHAPDCHVCVIGAREEEEAGQPSVEPLDPDGDGTGWLPPSVVLAQPARIHSGQIAQSDAGPVLPVSGRADPARAPPLN